MTPLQTYAVAVQRLVRARRQHEAAMRARDDDGVAYWWAELEAATQACETARHAALADSRRPA